MGATLPPAWKMPCVIVGKMFQCFPFCEICFREHFSRRAVTKILQERVDIWLDPVCVNCGKWLHELCGNPHFAERCGPCRCVFLHEISCSQRGKYEDYIFLVHNATLYCWSRPRFQRWIHPPSSGQWWPWWWKQYLPLKCLSTSMILHRATSQKAVIIRCSCIWNCTRNQVPFCGCVSFTSH